MKDVVLLAIWQQDRLLMGHHRNAEEEHLASPLCFPCGERKKGEKLVLTARNMLREMSGIVLRTSQFTQLTHWTAHDPKEVSCQFFLYSTRIDPLAGILPTETFRDLVWHAGPRIPWSQTALGLQGKVEWYLDHTLMRHLRA